MRLGVPNGIVDDSDFKPANFDRLFWSHSDFNDLIISTIAILIIINPFPSVFDHLRFENDSLNVDYSIENGRFISNLIKNSQQWLELHFFYLKSSVFRCLFGMFKCQNPNTILYHFGLLEPLENTWNGIA